MWQLRTATTQTREMPQLRSKQRVRYATFPPHGICPLQLPVNHYNRLMLKK